MAVSFLLKVLDFYYFFNAVYYWFYRSKPPHVWGCLMDCGFSWCSSGVLLWCDGAAPAPSCCPGCCCVGSGQEEAGREQGWAGRAGEVTQGQQCSVGSTCTGALEGTVLCEWMCNHRLVSQAPLLLLIALILKFKCESLNTNASMTCSHSSLPYLRIPLDLVTNPSKLQTNQM